jgi:hypothetical protein
MYFLVTPRVRTGYINMHLISGRVCSLPDCRGGLPRSTPYIRSDSQATIIHSAVADKEYEILNRQFLQ